MSYILDALKRADTERERERGNVPGLHSQNLPSGGFQRDQTRQSPNQTRYLAGVALLVLAVVAGWFLWPVSETAPVAASSTEMATEQAPPANDRSPAATSSAPEAPPERLTARAPDLPILAPPPPAPPPPPARSERPLASERASAAAAGTPSTATASATPAAVQTAGASAAPPPTTPVRRFAELSPELRAQLPQVNVSGSTYSSNPKLRTLIANGKVIQEGGEIAPGLQVETIGQRSAVLNFQGTRYSIGF